MRSGEEFVDPTFINYGELLAGVWSQVRGSLGAEANPLLGYNGRLLDLIRDVLRARLWAAQRYTVESILRHRFVTIRGSRKASKTFTAACVVEGFMQEAPTICITTAPSNLQVKTLLWGKINKLHSNASMPLRGRISTKSLVIGPDHYAIGFATNTSDRIQGFHAEPNVPDDPDSDGDQDPVDDPERLIGEAAIAARKSASSARLLIVVDEAAGVPQFIFDALRGSMLGGNVYVLLQANPTISINEPHDYARSHLPGSPYHRIKIAAKKSDDPVDCDAEFITPHWLADVQELEDLYPPDDPLHRPMVLAQFHEGDTSGRVITYAMLAAAAESIDDDLLVQRGAHVGVDTAWTGADMNVMALYVNSVKVSVAAWHSQDTIATWERIYKTVLYWRETLGIEIPWMNVHIDRAPVGAGVIDSAARAGCALDAVNFGGAPTYGWRDLVGNIKFKNRRAEMYWVLRELLRRRMARIPKKYTRSWEELAATTYDRSPGTLDVFIEPKEKIRERLGRSPDHADSDVLAFCNPARFVAKRVGAPI